MSLASSRAWVAAHPEQHRAAWRARIAANPALARARSLIYSRTWRIVHPEHRVADRARIRAWRAANPERAHEQKARHRARIAKVLATLTATEWEAILDAAGRACIYCGSRKQLTQDHLTPLSRGGDHTAENVAPACQSCNSSKGRQTATEFLAEA